MKTSLWLTVLGRGFVAALLLAAVSLAGTDTGTIPITTSSDEARDLFIKGRELSENLRNQEARDYLMKAVQIDPDFALAHYYLATVQPTFNAYFAGIERAKALAEKVSEGERLLIMNTYAAGYGKPGEAHDYLKKLATLHPQDARARYYLALSHFGRQEDELAMAQFRKAIEIAPEFAPIYNDMGYTLRRMGKMEEAGESFEQYIKLIPDDPNPYDSHAELLLKMGKYDESIAQYQKALDIDPNFISARFGIASNRCIQGDYDAAHKEIDKALAMARDEAEKQAALTANAVVWVDQGQPEPAMEVIRKRMDISRQAGDTLSIINDLELMGTLQLEFGNVNKAEDMFKKAAELIEESSLEPSLKQREKADQLYSIGRVYLERGQLDLARNNALSYMEEAEALQDKARIRTAHELAGMIALKAGDNDGAIAELNQANLTNPNNHYRLAMAYKGKGNTQKAKECCELAANYHAVNSLQYALVRQKAKQMSKSL